MGFLEYIIVTPSHHRVHHAINDKYLDKNFSQIFIVWDKWFGTFQAELPDVVPVYGTKKQVKTWNPIWINFMHIWLLAKDAWRTRSWWDKMRLWFMPTGWRPSDVKNRYPVEIVEDVYHRQKYETKAPDLLIAWSWLQLAITLVIMFAVLVNIAVLPFFDVLMVFGFLTASIFSYTVLMDRQLLAVPAEIVKVAAGIYLMYTLPLIDLLGNSQRLGLTLAAGYLVISLLLTLYYAFESFQTKPVSDPVPISKK